MPKKMACKSIPQEILKLDCRVNNRPTFALQVSKNVKWTGLRYIYWFLGPIGRQKLNVHCGVCNHSFDCFFWQATLWKSQTLFQSFKTFKTFKSSSSFLTGLVEWFRSANAKLQEKFQPSNFGNSATIDAWQFFRFENGRHRRKSFVSFRFR